MFDTWDLTWNKQLLLQYTTLSIIWIKYRYNFPITTFVTLDHKTYIKSHGYICSNSQPIVWVKIIKKIYAKNH